MMYYSIDIGDALIRNHRFSWQALLVLSSLRIWIFAHTHIDVRWIKCLWYWTVDTSILCHIGGHQRKLEPLRIIKLYLCQTSGTIDCHPKYDCYIAIQPCCCATRKRIKEFYFIFKKYCCCFMLRNLKRI